MKANLMKMAAVLFCIVVVISLPGCAASSDSSRHGPLLSAGQVTVQGKRLLRDGKPWIPHGFYQIAFEVAPANLARADHPFWTIAYQDYTPQEYQAMRLAGADSVRMQIAQAGADPLGPAFDRAFLDKALDAVHAARQAGLTVIISVQDETHIPGDRPIALPDDGTRRVWQQIAPHFADDRGVLYELLNEPRLPPTAQNWQQWAQAMNATIRTVREAGAHNVTIADGLALGHVLDGAPLLADRQVAYASHPYAVKLPTDGRPPALWAGPNGQRAPAWDAQFGTFAQNAPVIITEWHFGGYYCDPGTPEATVQFIQYLQAHQIGLEVGTWDWAPAGFGNARWHYPAPSVSKFTGLQCHQPGYGVGSVIQTWYTTGTPATAPI